MQAEVLCAGLVVSDLFVPPLDRLPEAGELVTVESPLDDVGGCAANTATSLEHLGIATRLVARVGADAHGAAVRAHLQAKGVDASGVLDSLLATSQTVILPVKGQDRRYIHSVGANAALTADDVLSASDGCAVAVIGGFLALPGLVPEELGDALAILAQRGTTTMLDVVIPGNESRAGESVRPVLSHVDWFFPNEDEARRITHESDATRQADVLLGWGCGRVVITRGARGALYADAEQFIDIHPVDIESVDPSGAGDAFVAGIVFGVRHAWSIGDTLAFAAALGASATRGLGCTNSLFTRDEARVEAESVNLTVTAR